MRVGVVGCGAIAQLVHLPILSGTSGVRVTAVCDSDLAKADRVADRF
ncbi:MAG: Gfo/Idh/MocA family oxidoreductase, partial [Acidobacteria bacterium]|nr:Gfo/Idh/MocA family oxidoreductase [Acidobacteriota bacterium]